MALLNRIHRELSRTLAKRGVLGTMKFASTLFVHRLARFAGRTRDDRDDPTERSGSAGLSFDERFGVQTAGIVHLGGLRIASDNWVHGLHYQPIVPPDFPSLLDPTGIDIPSATFIDLGSGKGRAVLLATQLPFKRVVGVEFSEELNLIAKENLRRFPPAERRCKEVEILCGDAAAYEFPAGPLVIYLYNPFETPVMQQVVEHVAATYRSDPRPIVVLYFTPLFAELWEALEFLEQTTTTDNLAVFVSREAGADGAQQTGSTRLADAGGA
jgi:SAM-dependent methyltransferase